MEMKEFALYKSSSFGTKELYETAIVNGTQQKSMCDNYHYCNCRILFTIIGTFSCLLRLFIFIIML